MTLSRQTTIITVFSLILIFISSFLIAVANSRAYYSKQLNINAIDTSTSLGLTISSKMQGKLDKTMVLSLVNAAFDRGHFKSIIMLDNSGKVVVKRYVERVNKGVPGWFVNLVPITTKTESALVMSGWSQLGEVHVLSDPSLAYTALWSTAKELFIFFLLTTLTIVVMTVCMIKITFRPLVKITKQAKDIGNKDLYTLEKLPRLKELKLLSATMNSMVIKLKEYFASQIEEVEKLQKEVYQDPITGLGNRRYFFSVFNQYLSDPDVFLPGCLYLFKIFGLIEYNKQNGFQAGDHLLCDISEALVGTFTEKDRLVVSRMDNPSFGLVFLEQDLSKIQSACKIACEKLENLFANVGCESLRLGIGIVACSYNASASDLLAKADKNISLCDEAKICDFHMDINDIKSFANDEDWQKIITKAVSAKKFNFYNQLVKNRVKEYHRECFSKLLNDEGAEISAAVFFPIVDECALGGEVDRLVVQEISKYAYSGKLSINLSKMTVIEEKPQAAFIETLQKLKTPESMELSFEFSESILDGGMENAKLLVAKLNDLGYQVGLDRVGVAFNSMSYLSEINISYLKLDASLTKGVKDSKDQQDIISKWVELVATLDIILIATAVETEGQLRALSSLGVEYFQGNYIQSPQLIAK